jgi:hypothetical protein
MEVQYFYLTQDKQTQLIDYHKWQGLNINVSFIAIMVQDIE